MKEKIMQNSFCTRSLFVGYDKKHNPLYVNVEVVSTNLKVLVYCKGKKIGEAGVIRKSDFDFEALYSIAIKPVGKMMEVA